MRIYTNFDLWNVLKVYRGLGEVSYRDESIDLDQEEGLRKVIRRCIEDGVFVCDGWEALSSLDSSSQLPILWIGDLESLNQSKEGKKGNMQLGTVMLNLIEAKILVRKKRQE
jgi:hypothetical protein